MPVIGSSTDQNVPGVFGENTVGEGVRGESESPLAAAVAGIALNTAGTGGGVYGESRGNGAAVIAEAVNGAVGVLGHSENREGILGRSTSPTAAAVAGISEHSNGTGAGVYGESRGNGAGMLGKSQTFEGVHGETNSVTAAAVAGIALNMSGTGAGVYGESLGNGTGVYGESRGNGAGVFGKSRAFEGVHGETYSPSAAAVAGIAFDSNGTGAGVYGESRGNGAGMLGKSRTFEGVHGETESPAAAAIAAIALNVNGTGAGVYAESKGTGPGVLAKSAGGVAGYFEGNVTVTGDLTVTKDIFLSNGDIAEEFTVDNTDYAEPGTVLVASNENGLSCSTSAYDTRVIGIVAGAGTFKPAIVLDKQAHQRSRVPVTILGKAYCKADASSVPIQVGDLLTTADGPGYLMKAAPERLPHGALVGKALSPLPTGKGLILVFVLLR